MAQASKKHFGPGAQGKGTGVGGIVVLEGHLGAGLDEHGPLAAEPMSDTDEFPFGGLNGLPGFADRCRTAQLVDESRP